VENKTVTGREEGEGREPRRAATVFGGRKEADLLGWQGLQEWAELPSGPGLGFVWFFFAMLSSLHGAEDCLSQGFDGKT
jgi:hypothetical protein